MRRAATPRLTMRRALGVPGTLWRTAYALAIVVLTASCADFESPEDPTGGLPNEPIAFPSFVSDIEPIFDKRCATGGCHSPASERGGLVLARGHAYDETVGVVSVLNPPMLRIDAGSADASWIVHMISPDAAAREGLPRMPLATTPLTPTQIDNIRRWIDQGAQRN